MISAGNIPACTGWHSFQSLGTGPEAGELKLRRHTSILKTVCMRAHSWQHNSKGWMWFITDKRALGNKLPENPVTKELAFSRRLPTCWLWAHHCWREYSGLDHHRGKSSLRWHAVFPWKPIQKKSHLRCFAWSALLIFLYLKVQPAVTSTQRFTPTSLKSWCESSNKS